MGVKKKGVCKTCRFYKRDRQGTYCAADVADRRDRRRNQEPCGWWKKRKAVKR